MKILAWICLVFEQILYIALKAFCPAPCYFWLQHEYSKGAGLLLKNQPSFSCYFPQKPLKLAKFRCFQKKLRKIRKSVPTCEKWNIFPYVTKNTEHLFRGVER
jgi:hypothetical protein